MTTAKLGIRYERLLLFSAPLTLLAALLLFLAVAASSQEDQVRARCLDAAAEALAPKIQGFTSKWQEPTKTRLDAELKAIHYRGDLTLSLIPITIGKCGPSLKPHIDRWAKLPPDQIVSSMKSESANLRSKPLELYGITMPEKARLSLLGNSVTVAPAALIQALQIALAPLLMLWLGSLYNTRVREVMLIRESRHLAELFPHMLNVYPSGRFPEPRRRVRFPNAFRYSMSFMYFVTRMVLLAMFIAPPVCMYLYGIYLLNFEDSLLYLLLAGGVIALFALSNVLAEMFPAHYMKWFLKSAGQ